MKTQSHLGQGTFARRISALLLFLCTAGISAVAQDDSFAGRIGCSAMLTGEGYGNDHSFSSLNVRFRYDITPSFSVFIPLEGSILLYNKSTTRNYDYASKSGIGIRLNHDFAQKDGIAVSLSGMSTIGSGARNYWQLRLMGEYVFPPAIWRSFVGIGVEYLQPYAGGSFQFGGFYPVVSIGLYL